MSMDLSSLIGSIFNGVSPQGGIPSPDQFAALNRTDPAAAQNFAAASGFQTTPGLMSPGEYAGASAGANAMTPGFAPFGNNQQGASIAPFGMNSFGVPFQSAAGGPGGAQAILQNAVNIPGQTPQQWGGAQVGGNPTAGSPQGQQDIGALLSSLFGQNQAGGVNMPQGQMVAMNPANNPQTAGEPVMQGLMGILQQLFNPGGGQQRASSMPGMTQQGQGTPMPQQQPGGGYQSTNQPGAGMDLTQVLGNLFNQYQTQQGGAGAQRSTMPVAHQAPPVGGASTGASFFGQPFQAAGGSSPTPAPATSAPAAGWGQQYNAGAQNY